MFIFHIKANKAVGYDSYDSHVVIANSAVAARTLVPSGDEVGWSNPPKVPDFWTNPELSSVAVIGRALDHETKPRVVISSFNAG
jgi:hypothetical protein